MTAVETIRALVDSTPLTSDRARLNVHLPDEDMNEILGYLGKGVDRDVVGLAGLHMVRKPKPLTDEEIAACLSVLP